MKTSKFLLLGLFICSLSGCNNQEQNTPETSQQKITGAEQPKNTETETVQTVDWFKEHKPERDAQMEKCNSNPGQLAFTPNCVNASRAEQSITWEAPGVAIIPKPIVFDEKPKK